MISAIKKMRENWFAHHKIDDRQWKYHEYLVLCPVRLGYGFSQENPWKVERSLVLDNQQFILTRITHQVIDDTAQFWASNEYQDGQYLIRFWDNGVDYTNGDLPAEAFLGTCRGVLQPSFFPEPHHRSGQFLEFPIPILYNGSETLHFRVTLTYNRQPFFIDETKIGLVVCGMKRMEPQ